MYYLQTGADVLSLKLNDALLHTLLLSSVVEANSFKLWLTYM